MILRLDIERLCTLEEVRDFLAGSEPVDFHFTDRRGAYDFVTRALRRLNYGGLSKADKGVVRRFVAKVTGWSRAQTTRLDRSVPQDRAHRGPAPRCDAPVPAALHRGGHVQSRLALHAQFGVLDPVQHEERPLDSPDLAEREMEPVLLAIGGELVQH